MLKVFDKNHVNVAKKLKRQRTISNGWFIIKLTFLQPPFATALYSFEHVTHIKKIKYLIFVKLENIGQLKCIFDKLYQKLKVSLFEWIQNLQTFS